MPHPKVWGLGLEPSHFFCIRCWVRVNWWFVFRLSFMAIVDEALNVVFAVPFHRHLFLLPLFVHFNIFCFRCYYCGTHLLVFLSHC